jgi:N-acyl-D-amino-acid deacylase
MTGMPAARVKLPERGRIRTGWAADLVVFDPATVTDKATFDEPFQYPVGISTVIVNGKFALREGMATKERSGEAVRIAGS